MDRPADRHHAARDVERRRVAAVEPVVRDLVPSPGPLVLEHAADALGAVALPALQAIAEAGAERHRLLQLDPRRSRAVRLPVEEVVETGDSHALLQQALTQDGPEIPRAAGDQYAR